MRDALALAIASLALVGASPAAQAKSKPCSRKGSHSIVSTKSVRVYRVKNSDGNYDLFGCLRSDGKRLHFTRALVTRRSDQDTAAGVLWATPAGRQGSGMLQSMIGVNALINALVNSGLMPVTGLPMPFVSYGGTSMIFSAAAIGILLNISKYSESLPNPKKTLRY